MLLNNNNTKMLSMMMMVFFIGSITNVSGHCWPCRGDGTAVFKNLGECLQCCEDLKFEDSSDPGADPEIFGAGGSEYNHRWHCREKHCQAWQKEMGPGNCEVMTDIDDGNGGKVITGWCPSDHRTECTGGGPCGCVYTERGGPAWPEGYDCMRAPPRCNAP